MSEHLPPSPPAARRHAPKWMWFLVTAGVLVIAGLGVGTVLFLQPGTPTQPTEPAPQPTTQPPPPEAAEPAPAPERQPVVLPGCEALAPEFYQRGAEVAAKYADLGVENGEIGLDRFRIAFGPAAQQALDGSAQVRGCSYPFNLEGWVDLYAAELGGDPKAALISALRADSDFVESTIGDAQVFTWTEPLESGHWLAAYTAHAFIGDVWLAGFGDRGPESYLPTASAAILTANPHLTR